MLSSPPVIALRRENKLREMRSALSPHQAGVLVQQGFRVLVQPSSLRCFREDEYTREGAEVSEDISGADLILGVKEIPPQHLLPHKTHLFFSHTLKAQPYSMPLLDSLLSQRVRLLDYEAITESGKRGGKRLVAFGRFAGIVGAIDLLRGVGERALALGHATPFLGIAAAWQYPSLEKAFEAVREAGRAIQLSGLPLGLCPFSIAVTGLCGVEGGGGGRVALGAKEVLDALGCVWVPSNQLPSTLGDAHGKGLTHCIYGAGLDIQDVVALAPPSLPEGQEELGGMEEWERRDVEQWVHGGGEFDRAHYKANPSSYRPVFHTRLAPHTSLLIHCSYWEPRFPRLLTRSQVQALSESGRCRLLGVSDISCDLGGAIEWSTQPTTIQDPFYLFDPLSGRSITNDISALPGANTCIGGGGDGAGSSFSPIGRGILTHAVDHLPSEVPRDATEHFGACLLPLLPALARNCKDPSIPLPLELEGAIVTSEGALTPPWAFIASLRAANERSLAIPTSPTAAANTSPPSPLLFILSGHIFDQGVLSGVLDIVEDGKCYARVLDCRVGVDRSSVTQITLELLLGGGVVEGGALISVACAIGTLCASKEVEVTLQGCGGAGNSGLVGKALEAGREEGRGLIITLPGKTTDEEAGSPSFIARPLSSSPTSPRFPPSPRILVLGSGFCSSPCVQILRSFNYLVTLGSAVMPEALAIAASYSHVTPVHVEVKEESLDTLTELIRQHTAVVSLVPAHLHTLVALACIRGQRNLITASYISPALAQLHDAAVASKVTILNECGLDPGIDHMGICRLVHTIQERGGVVSSLSSSCGGLPSPSSANNPLGYKWTWSPRGALLAMNNGATFLEGGSVRTVGAGGGALLSSASPFHLPHYPAFALERLPNRDSLPYAQKYGVEGGKLVNFMRGTLRYAGFSQALELLASVGLLEVGPTPLPPSLSPLSQPSIPLLTLLAALLSLPLDSTLEEVCGVLHSKSNSPSPLPLHQACSFLTWVGCPHSAKVTLVSVDGDPTHFSPLDTLLTCLGPHPGLALSPGEQDVVLMVHEMTADFPSHTEIHTSTLVEFGVPKGMTAMARLVGFTVGAATKALVEGGEAMEGLGVVSPTSPLFYDPILHTLEGLGVKMSDTVRVLLPH